MKRVLSSTFVIVALLLSSQAQENVHSQLVYHGADGKLVYRPYTEKGDILPDFSWCGYKGGGVELPTLPVVATIRWANRTDDTPRIQEVIDSLAKQPTDRNGFRGAILLKKGTYRIASPIRLTASGIVLRGEGNDKFNGTVLLATAPQKYSAIEIGGNGRLRTVAGSERQIIDDYVPSGTRNVRVSNASVHFKAGDRVAICRPSTATWIRAIDMDSIPPRPLEGETTYDSFRRLRESKGNANMNGTVQWKEGSKDLIFERTIVAVKGDVITLDIPLTNALQKEYGGGTIFKYEFAERISNCGVENIYGTTIYDETIKQENRNIGWYHCDENHANVLVSVRAAENCWVKKLTAEHFDCCVSTSPSAKFFTGQDLAAIHPVSIITGSRRYAYSLSGQMILFERCYSNYHRHQCVLSSSVAGPNAFVDCLGDMNFASSEPHHRWSVGYAIERTSL